jgi:2-polyprenyl-3-methyl-5-hydroxy-6-metoxy-1,4-benzoquinol methylase
VGVDIDPQTVEHATANYPGDKLHFTVGSMIDPELLAGADRFDVITCFEALEHVEEQDALIAVVRRLLAPGGMFLTSTPRRRGVQPRARQRQSLPRPGAHRA